MDKEAARERNRLAQAKWRKEHPDLNLKRAREYRANHPDLVKHSRSKSMRMAYANMSRADRLRIMYLKKYNLTPEKVRDMDERQKGLCAICCTPGIPRKSRWGGVCSNLFIDHCHQTGRVRGLLCFRCNSSIGRMNDDPILLKKAAQYLEG